MAEAIAHRERDIPGRLAAPTMLGAGLLVALILRYPLVIYNLPVAAHIDERAILQVLHHLRFQNLNPEFFHYPSLYFYLNHFLFGWLPFEQLLPSGRLLNLLLACLLALAAYGLGVVVFRSRPAGLIAALLALFSPILITNAGYLNTDILFATLVSFALLFWARFFSGYRYLDWAAGILFAGLALGSKYTAGIVLLSYLLLEFAWEPQLTATVQPRNRLERLLNRKLPPRLLTALMLLLATAGLAAYLLPQSLFMPILQSGAGVNSVVDQADLAFIIGMQRRMLVLGAGALLLALLTWRFPAFARRFTTLRPYAALGTAALLLLLTTPYALLDWKHFLYDVGFILKALSAGGTQPFWERYALWYVERESLLVVALALVGLVAALRRGLRPVLLLLLYLLLLGFSVGSATVGAIRYLSPLLPVLFVLAGFGVVVLWQAAARWRTWPATAGVALLLLLVALEMRPAVAGYLAAAREVDEMHQAYHMITEELRPQRVLFAGFTASFELEQAGYPVFEVALTAVESGEVFAALRPGDVLILDRESNRLLPPTTAGQLELLWSATSGRQQYLYHSPQE